MFEKYASIKNNTRSFHISIKTPEHEGLKVGFYVLYLVSERIFLNQDQDKGINISGRLDIFSETINGKYINCMKQGGNLVLGYANDSDKLAIQAEELSLGVLSAPKSEKYRKLIDEYFVANGWQAKNQLGDDLWFAKGGLEVYVEYLS